MGCAGQKSPIHWSPTSEQTELKVSAVNVSVPGTIAHQEGSCGVYFLMGVFTAKEEPDFSVNILRQTLKAPKQTSFQLEVKYCTQ